MTANDPAGTRPVVRATRDLPVPGSVTPSGSGTTHKAPGVSDWSASSPTSAEAEDIASAGVTSVAELRALLDSLPDDALVGVKTASAAPGGSVGPTGPDESPTSTRARADAWGISPLVPVEESPITGRTEILQFAGLLRWARLTEAEILAQLLRAYGEGRITESDATRPWSKQDFMKIAAEMGRKPMGAAVPKAIGWVKRKSPSRKGFARGPGKPLKVALGGPR